MNSKKINAFIRKLASAKIEGSVFNQYSYDAQENLTRRKNLSLYLHEVAKRRPTVMLVGEAPGYQGTRLSGIPFTSEHIMLKGVPVLDMFGAHKGYAKTSEFEKVHKEPSGTIVWKTLSTLGVVPFIWASFPFHPHKPGDYRSNRAPTKTELELGRKLLNEGISLFGVSNIVAVGNVAHATLTELGINTTKVRHPSHGGAIKFAEGLKKFLEQ